jgi:hypothetical protein
MQSRFPFVAVLVAVLLGENVRAVAAPAEERRLIVVEAPGNVLTPTVRERLHGAIAQVVKGQGLTLVSADCLPTQLVGCELPGCLPPIAAASGALFVLRVAAKFAQESFKLGIELWNSDQGKLLGRERRDCPICDEQDLWGSAALMTQAVLERALHEPAKPALARPVSSSPPEPPARVPALAQAPAAPPSRALLYAGMGLSVAGLAALVTGIHYWHVDGERACSDCDRVRDTRKLGLPMTITGGAVLALGAGMVAWSFRSGPAKISLGPAGLRIAGRF